MTSHLIEFYFGSVQLSFVMSNKVDYCLFIRLFKFKMMDYEII